jgi:GNAT superfamily N-acetyltransferase
MITGSVTIHVTPTARQYVKPLAQMQRLIFPTLTDDELLRADHFLRHLDLFPEGQFTALAHIHEKWLPAGSTSTFRISWDTLQQPHTFVELVDQGWFSHHNPRGEWLYGADMSVHPDYRRMGIASRLYAARRELVRRLNLRGEVASAMIPGYERHRHHLSIEAYVRRVVAGELRDPTLSVQIKNGFMVKGILYDHITDPRADNCAALIVRENPHYNRARA